MQADEPQKYRLEEGDGTTQAQTIVRELYALYQKNLQRWKDYRALFVFLGFIALFLAVLYLQRQSHVAYTVYSTVESVVVPKDKVMQDSGAVYQWLDNLLTVRLACACAAWGVLNRVGELGHATSKPTCRTHQGKPRMGCVTCTGQISQGDVVHTLN